MPATKITGYAAFSQVDHAADMFVGVDVDDTTMDASGTNKRFAIEFMKYAILGGIQGLELLYSSATALIIKAGKAGVNGKLATLAQTTYTSGSTMKDIANATVTLGNDKAYHVFISDAGVIGIEDRDATGDGADPVFDLAYDYWKAASTGLAWRRIGKFWTDASGNILRFIATSRGRVRTFILAYGAKLIINDVNVGSYTAITITPFITADDAMTRWVLTSTAISPNGSAGVALSLDGGANVHSIQTFSLATALATGAQGGVITDWLPYSATAHYLSTLDSKSYVGVCGYEQYV